MKIPFRAFPSGKLGRARVVLPAASSRPAADHKCARFEFEDKENDMSESGKRKKKYEKKGDRAKEILRKTHIEEAVGHFKAADPLHALQSFNLVRKVVTEFSREVDGGRMETVSKRINRDTDMITSYLLMAEEDKQEEKHGTSHTAPPPPAPVASGHHSTVWQLSKELKMKAGKKSRTRSRYEECYTDKDRAAAVNMGSRDIKQSLKMKRKAEKSKELSLPEETEPGALLALAGYEMTAKRTNIALDFINKALDLNPEDKNALVARSKCYLQLGEAKKALDDAEAALSIDGTFIKALYQKAEALYYLGDFEHSLMYFHRGLRLRPDMEGFRLGVQKAQEAIENIIGSRTTGLLATPEQLTAMLNGMRTVDELYKAAVLDLGKEPLPAPPQASTSSSAGAKIKNGNGGTVGKPAHKSIGKKRAEKQLLGDLYADKVYLEDLLTNKLDIISLNQDFANNDVAAHAKEGIEFLTTRQDFWRQQKPKNAGPIKIKRREITKKKT
ncbi:hypothetical protein GE061_009612 [Apolygus lucorum]|uniref:Outer dynein arm-docking complex subunit 4 n=1 Tax=Apolygus lucorum TaxID=248454 RepID=A0A6A4KGC8_APOLU|nr:hypothetical protein GE061_009612 [Apolygus lucorum]